jgi:nucleotide-binding universal stress UspA family protein
MITIRRIVLATDFSPIADGALEVAITMARAMGARLDIIHVSAAVIMLPPPFELVSVPALFPDLSRRVQEGLEARAAKVREAGLECETLELSGTAHVEIVNYARDKGADLIVLGTHGRGGLGHAVMGSVAERVLHRSPCPAVVVPGRT